jgi:hypothetical protein
MRNIVFCAFVILPASVVAIQPLEAGLRPLLERQQAITVELRVLNERLQSPATQPSERAQAYRGYLAVEAEKRQLACEIQRARRWAASSLVMYAAPGSDEVCGERREAVERAVFSDR